MNYEEMLNIGRENLPKDIMIKDRFEIPKVDGFIQGNTTIITNLQKIAKCFDRPVEHILKFLLKELATPGEIRNNNVIFGTKVQSNDINEKIKLYAKEYVLCSECGKPDTKIIKDPKGFSFLTCQACGAKRPIKSL